MPIVQRSKSIVVAAVKPPVRPQARVPVPVKPKLLIKPRTTPQKTVVVVGEKIVAETRLVPIQPERKLQEMREKGGVSAILHHAANFNGQDPPKPSSLKPTVRPPLRPPNVVVKPNNVMAPPKESPCPIPLDARRNWVAYMYLNQICMTLSTVTQCQMRGHPELVECLEVVKRHRDAAFRDSGLKAEYEADRPDLFR